jgi:hypothetical protein
MDKIDVDRELRQIAGGEFDGRTAPGGASTPRDDEMLSAAGRLAQFAMD